MDILQAQIYVLLKIESLSEGKLYTLSVKLLNSNILTKVVKQLN